MFLEAGAALAEGPEVGPLRLVVGAEEDGEYFLGFLDTEVLEDAAVVVDGEPVQVEDGESEGKFVEEGVGGCEDGGEILVEDGELRLEGFGVGARVDGGLELVEDADVVAASIGGLDGDDFSEVVARWVLLRLTEVEVGLFGGDGGGEVDGSLAGVGGALVIILGDIELVDYVDAGVLDGAEVVHLRVIEAGFVLVLLGGFREFVDVVKERGLAYEDGDHEDDGAGEERVVLGFSDEVVENLPDCGGDLDVLLEAELCLVLNPEGEKVGDDDLEIEVFLEFL